MNLSTDKFLGENIRLVRRERGLNQSAVAKAMGVSRPTLAAIENGSREPSEVELYHIAQFLDVSLSELLTPSSQTDVSSIRFRSSDALAYDLNENAQKLGLHLCRGAYEIESLARTPLRPTTPIRHVLKARHIGGQAEDVAMSFRQALGLGNSPIYNLTGVCEYHLGIRLFAWSLPSEVSGIYVNHDEYGASILCNIKHFDRRQRMTVAHEIGHFVVSPDVSEVTALEGQSDSYEERFCNRFAMALLCPSNEVRRIFDQFVSENGSNFSPRVIILLAEYFGVSLEAMTRRLEQLQLAAAGTFDSLKERGFGMKHVQQVVPDTVDLEIATVSPRLAMICADLQDTEVLSEGEIARKLKLDRLKVRELIDDLAVSEMP